MKIHVLLGYSLDMVSGRKSNEKLKKNRDSGKLSQPLLSKYARNYGKFSIRKPARFYKTNVGRQRDLREPVLFRILSLNWPDILRYKQMRLFALDLMSSVQANLLTRYLIVF